MGPPARKNPNPRLSSGAGPSSAADRNASPPPKLPDFVPDIYDVNGRPIQLYHLPCPPGVEYILTYGVKGGLLWYVPSTGDMYMREGTSGGVPVFMCTTISTIPSNIRPDGRCKGKLYPEREHDAHTEPVDPHHILYWFFSFLFKGFIAFHGYDLTPHQLKILYDYFHVAVNKKPCKKHQIPGAKTLAGLIRRGTPFPDEQKRCPGDVEVPLMAHKIREVDAAMEFTCREFMIRYGDFAAALGLHIKLGYESLRGKPPPPRDVPYTCQLLRPGKLISVRSFLLCVTFLSGHDCNPFLSFFSLLQLL